MVEYQELRFKVGLAWKDAYNPSVEYSKADVAESDAGVYVSKKGGNVGHPLDDVAWWKVLIDKTRIKEATEKAEALNAAIEDYMAVATEAEAERVANEESRVAAEEERVANENERKEAEAQRKEEHASRMETAEDATVAAQELAEHPTYVGDDFYVYTYDVLTHKYNKTNVFVKGEGFSVAGTFPTVRALNASQDTVDGQFYMVVSNTEDEDNGKLYVKDNGTMRFIVDMSGVRGFTGKTPQIAIGSVVAGSGLYSAGASLTPNGTDANGNPAYLLSLVLPRINYSNLTEAQIAELQKPAKDATAAANVAAQAANIAADAARNVNAHVEGNTLVVTDRDGEEHRVNLEGLGLTDEERQQIEDIKNTTLPVAEFEFRGHYASNTPDIKIVNNLTFEGKKYTSLDVKTILFDGSTFKVCRWEGVDFGGMQRDLYIIEGENTGLWYEGIGFNGMYKGQSVDVGVPFVKGEALAAAIVGAYDVTKEVRESVSMLDGKVGNLANLQTANKASIVAAINEAAASGGMTEAEKQQLTELDHKVVEINATLGQYAERASVLLEVGMDNMAIDAATGKPVAKSGWAISKPFTIQRGNEYLVKVGQTDGSVWAAAEQSIYEWDEVIVDEETGEETIVHHTDISYSKKVQLNAGAELPLDGYLRILGMPNDFDIVVSYHKASADATIKVRRDGLTANICTQVGNQEAEQSDALNELDERASEAANAKHDSIDVVNDYLANGYPTTLYGHGTPSASVLPLNLPKHLPWSGTPEHISQRYIDVDATSGGLYYAKPTLNTFGYITAYTWAQA